MRHRLTLPLAVLALCWPLSQAPAQTAEREEEIYNRIETLHGDAEGFLYTADSLATAMLEGDAWSVAQLGMYPLEVTANGEVYDVLDAQDFADNFHALVTPELQDAVGNFMLGDVIVTSEGVGFANGGLWMSLVCEDNACTRARWGVIGINN